MFKPCLLVLVAWVWHLPTHECVLKPYWIKNDALKGCEFTGYIPGGNIVTVERITAPVAKLEGNIIAAIGSKGALSANGAMHSTNALKAFGKLTGKFASIASKLGPCLGVFGVALGGLVEFTKPTPADILAATNKAITKLTDEVNDRLDEMKGYVDQKVINLEKDLINRNYKSLFIYWGNCLKEVTKDDVDECQEEAVKQILAAKPKFAILFSQVEAGTQPSVFDVKRIEASLISFRDYATLSIAALSAITETFKEDSTKLAYYQRYNTELKTEVAWMVKYARNTVAAIVKMHCDGNNCLDTFKCTSLTQAWEGWAGFKKNTYSYADCSCIIDRGELQRCTSRLYGRVDGKGVSAGYPRYISSATNYGEAIEFAAKPKLNAKSITHKSAMRKVIQTYWDNELLDLVPLWENIGQNVANDALLSDQEMQPYRDGFELGPNYDRRRAETELMVADMNARRQDSITNRGEYLADDNQLNERDQYRHDDFPAKQNRYQKNGDLADSDELDERDQYRHDDSPAQQYRFHRNGNAEMY